MKARPAKPMHPVELALTGTLAMLLLLIMAPHVGVLRHILESLLK